jgi:hypothetical protein
MATTRFQKGSLKQAQRAEGRTGVLRYLVTRPQDGKRVEGTPLVVGLVKDYPTKSSANQRVVDLGLLEKINSPQQIGKLTFQQIAYHYMPRRSVNFVISVTGLKRLRRETSDTASTVGATLQRWTSRFCKLSLG